MNERKNRRILRAKYEAMRQWQECRDAETKPYTGTREERRTLHNAYRALRAREKRNTARETRDKLKRLLERVER